VSNEANRLQHAVNEIYTSPKLAEQELKRLPGPTAKAYLAFLYLSRKVVVPAAGKRIDSLMHDAVAAMPDDSSIGNIDREQIHYTKMVSILTAIRFISEAFGGTKTPTKIFEQYPEDCMEAFAAFYFSSMERHDTFELTKADDILNIPQVKILNATLFQMYGDPREPGTMVHGVYRNLRMAAIEASLAPQVYLHQLNSAGGKIQDKAVTDYLQMWANQELWNQQTYLEFQRESEAAIKPLADHYRSHFKISDQTARSYAKAALRGYSLEWLDRFSHEAAKNAESNPIYLTFSAPGVTLEAIKQKLGQKVLTEPELIQALHLAILTGGSLETIDWIIKQGAPLKGGHESPLFSAVTRPDVATLLIKAGADVNETNPLGKTPLIQASQYSALATMKLLVQSGADVNQAMLKVDSNLPESVAHGLDINYITGSRTALMYAAAFSNAATIEYLISKGADKQAVDSLGWKPAKFLGWNKILSDIDRQKMLRVLN